MGRPKLPDAERTVCVTVRIPAGELARAEARALAEGKPLRAVIRESVAEYAKAD